MTPAVAPLAGLKLDHLVYAVFDLETAADSFEERLGVRPSPGGRHPGIGTHNALLSLGGDRYLEIIAADPTQPAPLHPRPFGLDDLVEPRLVTWAGRPPNLEEACAGLRSHGREPGEIRVMSRMRPDGVELSWRLAVPPPFEGEDSGDRGGVVPFLIDWGETPLPATTLPIGPKLEVLVLSHPEHEALWSLFGDALPASVALERARVPRLTARISVVGDDGNERSLELHSSIEAE